MPQQKVSAWKLGMGTWDRLWIRNQRLPIHLLSQQRQPEWLLCPKVKDQEETNAVHMQTHTEATSRFMRESPQTRSSTCICRCSPRHSGEVSPTQHHCPEGSHRGVKAAEETRSQRLLVTLTVAVLERPGICP